MSKKIPTKYHEQKDKAQKWLTTEEGKKFSVWWANHRHSGYATKGRETRWGIKPWEAVLTERYMAEFNGWSDHFSEEEILAMRAEQYEVEKKTGELEARFGPMFWKKMTPAEFIANAKMVAQEEAGDLTASQRAKMDAAYAYEPGQSEEETANLSRRRE